MTLDIFTKFYEHKNIIYNGMTWASKKYHNFTFKVNLPHPL